MGHKLLYPRVDGKTNQRKRGESTKRKSDYVNYSTYEFNDFDAQYILLNRKKVATLMPNIELISQSQTQKLELNCFYNQWLGDYILHSARVYIHLVSSFRF